MAEKQREEQELFCLQQKALIDQQQESMQTVSVYKVIIKAMHRRESSL